MNMPTLTPSSATYLSAGAWLFNFLCQMYGMLSDPNMKDVADKYHAFLSPQPFAIALFFFPQTCLQVYWIYRLFKLSRVSSSSSSGGLTSSQDDELESPDLDEEAVRYAPFFILGNLCIGLWMIFWNNEFLGIADIFVNLNSAAQLYFVFVLLAPISRENVLTHLVAKMFAGIGVLDVLDNFSSAFMNYNFTDYQPGIIAYVLTLLAAAGLGFISDPIFGACIVYDFLALFAGQIGRGMWAFVLLVSAGISAALVAFRTIREKDTYQALLSNSNSVI